MLPNANEIDTKNMKCTWPMRAPMQGDPTRPIFHVLALGLRWVREASHWVREAFQIPTCWYLQHKSLGLGELPNTRTQSERVCVAVEYRLIFYFTGKTQYKPCESSMF